jgi:hypothetical protein
VAEGAAKNGKVGKPLRLLVRELRYCGAVVCVSEVVEVRHWQGE